MRLKAGVSCSREKEFPNLPSSYYAGLAIIPAICLRAQPRTLPGFPRRSVYGEGQGERSAEIIYKHITKFHYFYFVDSGTQEYKSS